ncbi:hypothetical protein [Pseudorhodoferax sp. Leaf274]|uniref:hypothetical protein n=1 Tax=Pseudorhodoferax sp. Leaf274 TaxID=1736318 RepID=UPI000702F3CE|nr:hypothetical protein [Pseudorhodoferax sp. Leaf274]KQP43300.1 hypothetical protein ASF44_06970 [Pseudorhodoferax sp. Leaf274]
MPTPATDNATRARRAGTLWLAAALLAAGCGAGSEAVLLVPFFTFGFSSDGPVAGASQQVFLNLSPGAPATATGDFDASSTLSFDNHFYDITGSYAGCTLRVNLPASAPAPLATSYDGRFTGPDTIELTPRTSGLPVLTVVRGQGQTDGRPKTC